MSIKALHRAAMDLFNIIAHLRAQPILPAVPRSHEFTLRGRWSRGGFARPNGELRRGRSD